MLSRPLRRSCALSCAGLAVAGLLAFGCGEHAATDPGLDSQSEHGPLATREAAPGQQDPAVRQQLLELRQASASFHNPEKAMEAGWNVRFPANCLTHSELGTMGLHLLNPGLVDGTIEVSRPELLVYHPRPNGKLQLVAVEYVVPAEPDENGDPTAPRPDPVFGDTEFTLFRVEGVTVWQHHVWVWRDNPNGLFSDWNPKISCDAVDPENVLTYPLD